MTTTAVAVTFDEMSRLAEAVARSGLFGMKTPEQALALMAIAQAEGQHPALAARDYHIVQGRPVLKSDAMLARFQAAGGRMKMIEYSDECVRAEFSHPQGGTVTLDWTIERAKRAGLTGKDVWKSYPRNMLRARVISEGIRTVYPGATQGLLTPEEAADTTPPAEVDVTPAQAKAPALSLASRIATVAESLAPKVEPEPVAEPTPEVSNAEVVTLAEVVAEFDRAQTTDDLHLVADKARGLPQGDQAIARKRYAERRKELSA